MTPLPETMSGVLLTGHGGPETLAWRTDLPVPRPGPGDVVIRVAAAGVNNTDINIRIGWYARSEDGEAGWGDTPLTLPRIQGADVCGHVAAVGEGVDAARIGERVLVEPVFREWDGAPLPAPWYIGSECDGGFAQFVRVPARHAHAVDSPLTETELASFPCSYITAENMLTRAAVGPGDRVLVTGASGGVGSATVQLARARGAEVTAVTSPSKAGALQELGAARCLSRDADLAAEMGRGAVDVVVDLVGGPGWPALLDILRPGGRYAVAGAIAGPMVELDLRTLYLKDLSLFGCTISGPEVFPALIRRIEAGEVRPLVARTWPLRQIAEAQAAFQEKSHIGKFVLTVD